MSATDSDQVADAEREDRRRWICPSCGHFIVSTTPAPTHTCKISNHVETFVAYIDSAQADDIRRTVTPPVRSNA